MKKFNFKKTAASIAAFTLVLSAAVSPNASLISELVPVNSISASAATELTSGNWKYVETSSYTCEVTGYTGTAAKVTIPVAINGHTVTSIAARAFDSNKTITYVAIPKGVTEIKNYTFINASNLTTVVLPSGITKIGVGAFKNTKLTSVTLPSAVKYIQSEAFYGTPITSISIPGNVTALSGKVFSNCTKLTTVSLPSKLEAIYSQAFDNCTSLKSITIPESVTTIQTSAFRNCSALTKVTLPSSVRTLGSNAFSGCTGITSITLPSALKTIGSSVFSGCTKLTSLTLPNSLDGVSVSAFRDTKISYIYNVDLTKLDEFNANHDEHYEDVLQTFKYLNTVNGINMFSTTNGVMTPNNKVIAATRVLDDNVRVNKYITQEVKRVVGEVTSASMTESQKAKALHDWICNKVYFSDTKTHTERKHVDSSVFLNESAVCDGYARAYTLLLQEAGIEAYYVLNSSHAWVIAKLDGYYFHIDVSHDDGYGRYNTTTFGYSHYMKSDAANKKLCGGAASHATWRVRKPSSLYNYASSVTAPVCKYSIGDITKDGKVDNADQNYLLNYIVNNKGYTIAAGDKVLADTNFDGKIDICDATAINKFKD